MRKVITAGATLLLVVLSASIGLAAGPDLSDLCTILPVEPGIVYTTPNGFDARIDPHGPSVCVGIYGDKIVIQPNTHASTGSAFVRSYGTTQGARLTFEKDIADWRKSGVSVAAVPLGDEGYEIGIKDQGRLIWIRSEYYLDSASAQLTGTGIYAGMVSTAAQARVRADFMDKALAQALAARKAPAATAARPTPTPLAAVQEDRFSIDHIEVVQAVQTADNLVPLVAGKRTVVRVFAKDSKDDDRMSGATAKLRVTTSAGRTVTLSPQNGPVTIQPHPDRVNPGHSLTFVLPDDLAAAGVITIEAELVLPEGQKQAHPTARTNVRFDRPAGWPAQFRIAYLAVCQPTPADCPSAGIGDAEGLLTKIFPVGESTLRYFPLPSAPVTWHKPIDTPEARAKFIAFVRKVYDMIEASSPGTMDQLVAWLPYSAGTGTFSGWSDPAWSGGEGHVSWAKDVTGIDRADAEHTVAHEIAHNIGLRHPDRTQSAAAAADHACGGYDAKSRWPYADATIQEVGYDVAAGAVVNTAKFDLMSYCKAIWISPYSFQQLFEAQIAARPTTATPRKVAVVSGTVRRDGSAGKLDPAYQLTSSAPSAVSDARSDHCLRFSGTGTATHCFSLAFTDHFGAPVAEESFSLLVDVPAGTTKIALMRGAKELDALSTPPAPPAISISGPAAGSALPASHTVAWTSDGPASTAYTVMYSPDGRKTWYPVAVDESAASVTVDTTKLPPGQDAWFRVLAADGLATSVAESGPYTITAPQSLPAVPVAVAALGLAALGALILRSRARRPRVAISAAAAPAAATAPTPTRVSRFCGHCGSPIEPGAKYCVGCGSALHISQG